MRLRRRAGGVSCDLAGPTGPGCGQRVRPGCGQRWHGRHPRGVGLLESRDLVLGQRDRGRRDRVVDVVLLRRADDRRGDGGLAGDPRERDLRHARAPLLGDLPDRVDDGAVRVLVLAVQRLAELVGVGTRAGALRVPRAGDLAARERAPRDDTDAGVLAERVHLALLLALEQVVLVLHAHEGRPAVQLGDVLHLGELPCPHARRADVPGLPGLDDVVQRLHRLLDGRVRVEAVDLVQVDVVGAEAGQRGVDLVHDRRTRQSGTVPPGAHPVVDLREDLDVLARGEFRQELPGDLLAAAGGVDVRGVERGDARLEGAADEGPGVVESDAPGMRTGGRVPVGHHPEDDARDLEAGAAEAGGGDGRGVGHAGPPGT